MQLRTDVTIDVGRRSIVRERRRRQMRQRARARWIVALVRDPADLVARADCEQDSVALGSRLTTRIGLLALGQ